MWKLLLLVHLTIFSATFPYILYRGVQRYYNINYHSQVRIVSQNNLKEYEPGHIPTGKITLIDHLPRLVLHSRTLRATLHIAKCLTMKL